MPISNWPYSNTQQLNLDWILQVVKQFEDDYSGIEAALNSAIQSINQKTGTSITVLEAEKNQILNAIVAAREAAVSDVTTAKTAAIGDIDTEADASVARLQALMNNLPEDFSSLLATLAPTYDNLTFPVARGTYCWYSGTMYAANQDINTSETWTAGHWDTVVLGTDLAMVKSSLSGTNDLIGNVEYAGYPDKYIAPNITRINVTQTGNVLLLNNANATNESTSNNKRYYRLNDGIDFMSSSDYNADTLRLPLAIGHRYRFLVKKIGGTVTAETGASLIAYIKSTGTVDQTIEITTLTGEEYFDFVADTSLVNLILRTTNGIACTNLKIAVYLLDLTEMADFIGMDDVPTEGSKFPVSSGGVYASKLDSTYDMSINWAEAFGDELNLLGWQTGYYNTSGATGSSSDYMRTNRRAYYTATHGDESLTFTVPSGYNAAIAEYDADGTNGTRHGNVDSGENTITIALTEGHLYKFCIGKWSGDADDDITEAFISTVTATVKRSFLEWQKEQDARLDAISGASGIPEYYAGSYLQTKLNTITTLQKSLSDKTDGFIFISDYHIRTNRGNSLALIKEVARKTGIQKIFFAGDAGGRMGGDSGYVVSMQRSAQVWSDLADCAEEFYGSLGNHEWIDGSVYGKGAMFANYLNRFKQKVHEMSAKGSYYIEDPVCKIRYYFINDSWATSALDYDWFGKSLEAMTENGWYIAVIVHHGFIPGSASKAEYDGVEIDTTTASNVIAKVLTRILQAYQAHTTLTATISGTSYSWDFSGTSGGGAIGVFCGHYHHGTLFDKDDVENEWGIPVWRAGTDSMQAGTVFENYVGQKVPWYWENGVIGGTKVIRTPGTTDEQCFYAIQIDMTSKLVHITAIGGDHDWEFNFT